MANFELGRLRQANLFAVGNARKRCLAVAFLGALTVPVLLGLLGESLSRAQSQAGVKPSFDVVSVKLNPSCNGDLAGLEIRPGRLNLPCNALRGLIRMAYRSGSIDSRPLEVIGGPAWINSDRYQISAKAENNASVELMTGLMMQTLLEERFQLKVHREFRNTPVYELSVAKSNPNLRPSKEGSCTPRDLTQIAPPNPGDLKAFAEAQKKNCGYETGSGTLVSNGLNMIRDWQGISMQEFAALNLTSYVDRPVIDKTGLAGRFDFHLEFFRERRSTGVININGVDVPEPPPSSPDGAFPSIFSALKDQLGLKLSPANAPLEVIVIDQLEKPSPN